MFTHACEAGAAVQVAGRRQFFRKVTATTALVIALLVAGCSTAPSPLLAGPDPADPAAVVAPTRYRSATASYVPQRPTAPAAWGRQDERVAPQPKSGQ